MHPKSTPELSAKDVARFWKYVHKSDGCWPWTGALTSGGYGAFHVGTRAQHRTLPAHRVAYILAVGPVPDGLLVCHSCDVHYAPGDRTYRACCNPAHLFAGTNDDNMADMVAKGRSPRGERNVARAHPELLARGDRNGRRLHPESYPSGDQHWIRRHPEWVPRGDRHYTHRDPSLVRKGEQIGTAKLTDEQVREIRRRYVEGGVTQKQIAAAFGISRSLVTLIIAHKAWAHVT